MKRNNSFCIKQLVQGDHVELCQPQFSQLKIRIIKCSIQYLNIFYDAGEFWRFLFPF
jgi:hypothetical protein